MYKVKEVCEMFNIHELTCLELIKSGRLKAIKLGRAYRIPKEALDKFIEKSKV